jgi:hypothetical protein
MIVVILIGMIFISSLAEVVASWALGEVFYISEINLPSFAFEIQDLSSSFVPLLLSQDLLTFPIKISLLIL